MSKIEHLPNQACICLTSLWRFSQCSVFNFLCKICTRWIASVCSYSASSIAGHSRASYAVEYDVDEALDAERRANFGASLFHIVPIGMSTIYAVQYRNSLIPEDRGILRVENPMNPKEFEGLFEET